MPGRAIQIRARDGGAFSAYLAVPEGGKGPGLVLGQEIFGVNRTIRDTADNFAEEGYVVLAPDLFWRMKPGVELGYSDEDFKQAFAYYERFEVDKSIDDIGAAMAALKNLPECSGKVGVIGFCLGGKLAYLTAARERPDIAISFYGVGIPERLGEAGNVKCPMVFHCPDLDKFLPPDDVAKLRAVFRDRADVGIYSYPGADHGFYNKDRPVYHRPSVSMAHTRTIAALRRAMGPNYDLSALWDKHIEHEFITRDVDATMRTMVAEPYVNHIPTMTGGVGYKELHRFYLNHFVHANPADTHLIPVSRTVGADRVVDEMVFCFTHDREIDWLLPGVKPTGRYVEVPVVAIINFRGPKLYHEHIYWDQASVLAQIGLLDTKGLPVAGHDEARKMLDAASLPSNTLMARWKESAPRAG